MFQQGACDRRVHGCLCTIVLLLSVGSSPLWAQSPTELPPALARYFAPPPEFASDFGSYRSPLLFDDGTKVMTASSWALRREE
ncbi:MAG: hypothetical protein ACK55I_29930, partial [bacterium]